MITAEAILDHLAYPVTDAPHLMVCTCGQSFRAVPAQSSAVEQWAVHLADVLNQP